MTDLNKLLTPLFLSEKEIRKIIELIFFSYREFTLGPDEILAKQKVDLVDQTLILATAIAVIVTVTPQSSGVGGSMRHRINET